MTVRASTTRPDLRKYVAICTTCRHWQIDIRPGAISDLGGWLESLKAIGEAHVDHLADECPNAGGRMKVFGQWAEPPKMQSGRAADGTIELAPLPRWWVTR